MANHDVTLGDDDDGFGGSMNRGFRSNSYLKWTAAAHWTDRDGLTPPNPLLVVKLDEELKRWKNNVPEVISAKPLPDPDGLNGAIPTSEWEKGIDGQKRKPWDHYVVVQMVNTETGEHHTYSHYTTGAHIAVDQLHDAVVVMRSLRGERVMPLVNLTERPMKTNYGQTTRPHFVIVGWKSPGDGGKAIPATPPPSLPTPAAAAAPATATAAAPAAAATTKPAKVKAKPKPKPTISVDGLKDVAPVTTAELLNDEIPTFD
jgi:hypothetical protein